LTVNAGNLISGSLTQQFDFFNQNPLQCKLVNIYDFDSLGTIYLNVDAIVTGGVPPYLYSWSDSNMTASTDFMLNPSGQLSEGLMVTDANGSVVIANLSTVFAPGSTPNICAANFSFGNMEPIYDTVPVPIPLDSLQFSNVTIEYTDSEGRFYSSDRIEQKPDAYFEIVQSEDYDKNELGQKTRKLTVRFACELWDAAGEKVIFKEGEAVIAVAYP
jgi:hypothetical protein